MTENEIATIVVDAAFKIHTTLSPGLLESVYETVLSYELEKRGLKVERQKSLPVVYESVKIDEGYCADIVVEGKVVVELKSVELIAPVHKKQLLTYLRLLDAHLDYSSTSARSSLRMELPRVVNGLEE